MNLTIAQIRAYIYTDTNLDLTSNGCGDVRTLHVPKRSLYLNLVEACRRGGGGGRRDLPVSEHCEAFGTMCGVISEYCQAARFGLDLYADLCRLPSKILTNL